MQLLKNNGMTRSLKMVVQGVATSMAMSCGLGVAVAQSSYLVTGNFESFNVAIDGTTLNNALAGGIDMTVVSGPGSSFETVCSDISGTLYLGGTYSYDAPVGFAGQTGIAPTWGAGNGSSLVSVANASAAIQAAADVFYKFQSVFTEGAPIGGLGGETVLDDQAALQLAVWAALYNTTAGQSTPILLNGSRFSVQSLATEVASGSWGSIAAGTADALTEATAMLDAVNLSDQYSGDLLVPDPVPQNGGYGPAYNAIPQEVLINITPVPEPTTLIAGGLLLLPFAASALRSRNKRQLDVKRVS